MCVAQIPIKCVHIPNSIGEIHCRSGVVCMEIASTVAAAAPLPEQRVCMSVCVLVASLYQ